MLDASVTSTYAYTVAGQVYTEDGPFASDTVTNTYVDRIQPALALHQPTGACTNGFIYDAAARLTNVTSQAGSFGYLCPGPGSLVSRIALPNTSFITNTFDGNARLLSTFLKNSGLSTLNSHTYVYNPANQRTQHVFTAGSPTVNYTYDKIGQLTIADSSVDTEDRSYVYDPAWNLTNRSCSTFTVDGKNQMI